MGHGFCGFMRNILGLEDIVFFSVNSPFTPGRNLWSEGLERGHKESRRNVCWHNQGHKVCDQDLGPEYGPFMILRFFKELLRVLLYLGG